MFLKIIQCCPFEKRREIQIFFGKNQIIVYQNNDQAYFIVASVCLHYLQYKFMVAALCLLDLQYKFLVMAAGHGCMSYSCKTCSHNLEFTL